MYPHWLRHRWSRSAPSDRGLRTSDVAVAQNDLPLSCSTGPGAVAHPASRSMTSPSPSVIVMIRPAAVLMRPPPEMGVRWPKQPRDTSQMDRLRMRGEELAVAAPWQRLQVLQDATSVMASPPSPRRRWLLEGAGAAFQHVLTASTVTYEEFEHYPIPYSTPMSLG